MNTVLKIRNDNQEIVETNYWSSEYNRRGICYLSFNAGALRILVSDRVKKWIQEMKTGSNVIVIRLDDSDNKYYRVVFDDGSTTPFSILTQIAAVDRLLPSSEHGRELVVTVWFKNSKGQPVRRLKRNGVFRCQKGSLHDPF